MRIVIAGDLYISAACGPIAADSSLQALMQRAAYRMANLEAPILKPGEKSTPPAKYGPRLSQGQHILPWLGEDAFNIVGLANNHFMDHGPTHMQHTLEVLAAKGVVDGGMAEGDAALPKLIWLDEGEERIALVCVAEYSNGCRSYPTQADGHAWVLNPYLPTFLAEVRQQASQLWLYVHAGLECYPLPLPQWQAIYRSLIDLGADLVIGHHPHIVQGKETYKGGTIYYSLGNFLFPKAGADASWHTGMVLELNNETDGKWQIQEHFVRHDLHHIRLLQGKEDEECRAELAHISTLLTPGNEAALYAETKAHCLKNRELLTRYYSFQPFRLRKPARTHALQRLINGIRYILMPGTAHLVQNDAMLRHNLLVDTNRFFTELALADL